MAVVMCERFGENKSSTSISYKKYDVTPEDKYPTFSICFKGTKIHLYIEEVIFSSYGIRSDQYKLMLEGKSTFTYEYNATSRLYRKSPTVLNQRSSVKFESMVRRHFEFKNILSEANFTRQDKAYNTYYSKNSEEQPPLYKSHEMPEIICFTRMSQNISKSSRVYDSLAFDIYKLRLPEFQEFSIQIIIHYPGQLMRSLVRPSFSLPIPNLRNMGAHLRLKVSQGTVLRYRTDSNEPCDEEIENFDAHMQEYITNETGCIHPFWKTNYKGPLDYGECKSPEQFKRLDNRIKSYNKKSCAEMFKSVSWNWEDKSSFKEKQHIIFEYIDDYYQEIEYLTSFGTENLISNLGGFIGIFLGYSLMQVPELLGKYKMKCSLIRIFDIVKLDN